MITYFFYFSVGACKWVGFQFCLFVGDRKKGNLPSREQPCPILNLPAFGILKKRGKVCDTEKGNVTLHILIIEQANEKGVFRVFLIGKNCILLVSILNILSLVIVTSDD